MSNTSLLGALLILLVVEPFLSEETSRRWAFDTMLSVVLVAAVWTVGWSRRLLIVGLLLVVPALVVKWSLHLWPSTSLGVVWMVLALALLVFTVLVVLSQVLRSKTVSQDTLAGAVAGYLLLGLIWAMTFAIIEVAHPGSFHVAGQPLAESPIDEGPQIGQFLYLSLVTLTTVGYGDMLPVTAVARRFAVLEAVVGQLYLAVLVARLVSQRISTAG